MNIGIDIDDTLSCNIKNELMEACIEYAKSLNKDFDLNKKIDDKYNNGNIYKDVFKFNEEELKYFLGPIQESITKKAKLRKNVVKVINLLKQEGHKIIIITARDYEFHDFPYEQSEEWLIANKIQFDKLIVNARDKRNDCINENIEFFIDDNSHNCELVEKLNIKTFIVNDNTDWLEIYKVIKNSKNK